MKPSEGRYLGEGLIELPLKATTRAKLHELGHKRFGHEPGKMGAGTFVDNEIDAEKWAWETMSKTPTHRVGLPALVSLIEDYDFSIQEALDLVTTRLKAKGVTVTRRGREDLARFASGEF